MSHPLFALSTAITKPSEDNFAGVIKFVELFCSQMFQVRAKNVDDNGVQRTALAFETDENGDTTLTATVDWEAAFDNRPEDCYVTEVSGMALIGMAKHHRFVLWILGPDKGNGFSLTGEQLLAMESLQALENTESGAPAVTPDQIQSHYPKAFKREIYAWCLGQPDIKRCWMALAQFPGSSVIQVVVMVDSRTDHHDAIKAVANHYLPPGQLLIYESTYGEDTLCSRQLRTMQPFYTDKHAQNWWSRMWRWLRPVPLPFLQMAVSE